VPARGAICRRESSGMTAPAGLQVLLGLAAAVVLGAALATAQTIFAPVAFALFTIALAWPLQRRLEARLPALVAVLITLIVTMLVIGGVLWVVVWGFLRAGQWLIANAAGFQQLYLDAAAWFEGHGLYVAGTLAERFDVSWLIRVFQHLAGQLQSLLSFTIVTFIFVLLGMLEVRVAGRQLAALEHGRGRLLLEGARLTAAKFQRYMLVRTWMSLLTGLSAWAFTALCGLDLALEWGALSFALNYIPFIGPLIATVLPTLFALAQFQSLQFALLVFAGLNIFGFIIGSYLEPRVAGKAVAVSPFMVLLAVFLWAFLWGIPGAFIGVPILIAALTFASLHPGSRWLAALLSGEAPPP
jgi:predicted PurR-regulated permease PerM